MINEDNIMEYYIPSNNKLVQVQGTPLIVIRVVWHSLVGSRGEYGIDTHVAIKPYSVPGKIIYVPKEFVILESDTLHLYKKLTQNK